MGCTGSSACGSSACGGAAANTRHGPRYFGEEQEEKTAHVFLAVNGSSGGNAAQALLDINVAEFRTAMEDDHALHLRIFDLKDEQSRKTGFANIAQLASIDAETGQMKSDVRVVACGGDGTVKWVLAELSMRNCRHVPIGVIPFGTGNDMARALGWGSTAPARLIGNGLNDLIRHAKSFVEADAILFDVWLCTVELDGTDGAKFLQIRDKGEVEAHKGSTEITELMINYMGIGADGETMYSFEKNRTDSQVRNKLVYFRKGTRQTLFPPKKLMRFVESVKSRTGEGLERANLKQNRILLFLNIPSYSSGANPWRRKKDFLKKYKQPRRYTPQYVADKKLECLTFSKPLDIGSSLVFGTTTGITRIAQTDGYEVNFKPGATAYLQIDGEALKAVNVKSVKVAVAYQIKLLRAKHARAVSAPPGVPQEQSASPETTQPEDSSPVEHTSSETAKTQVPANKEETEVEATTQEKEQEMDIESEKTDEQRTASGGDETQHEAAEDGFDNVGSKKEESTNSSEVDKDEPGNKKKDSQQEAKLEQS